MTRIEHNDGGPSAGVDVWRGENCVYTGVEHRHYNDWAIVNAISHAIKQDNLVLFRLAWCFEIVNSCWQPKRIRREEV